MSDVLLQSSAAVSYRLAKEPVMAEEQPSFSADSAGVVSLVGWDDPSNIGPTGTTSWPIDGALIAGAPSHPTSTKES
jgi:hypothetical protein